MNKIVKIWTLLTLLMMKLLASEILPADISYLIQKNGFSKNELGIYIKETKSNKIVTALNIDKQMTPASVIKVYSAYSILLELGYDYRWSTNFYYTGGYNKGTVGDLVVQAQGDPTLNSRDIPQIVKALKKKGIRRIKRNIVIDRSYFTVPKRDSSHFDKNIYSAYNAMPDALMFNEHTSKFTIRPRKGRAEVNKQIPGNSYRVSNNIKIVNGSCRGTRAYPTISVDHSAATPILRLSGNLSSHCGKRYYTYVITKPYKEFYAALVNELRRQGISYNGKMRLYSVPKGSKKVYTHYSNTLEKIISTTSKKSNNVFARHLLLTLGAKIYGAPSNLNKGRRAVEHVLNRYRLVNSSKTCIDNGCGLSRESRVTARNMSRVLDHAFKSYGSRWMRTLSIAGVDGTIKRRFRSTIVKNRAWMKTGTLDKVKNISGYLQSNAGELYTVVILVNSKRAKWAGAKLQNEIMKWLVNYNGSGVNANIDFLQEDQKPKRFLWDTPQTNHNSRNEERTRPTEEKHYYVQVGSFSQSPNKDFLKILDESGLTYTITEQEGYKKVMVGPYSKPTLATQALKELKAKIAGAYVTVL